MRKARKEKLIKSKSRFSEIVLGFRKARILVIGDLMLDEFVWGEVSRISPEAPIPVVVVRSETSVPGGAANVAANVRSLGASVFLTGVVGNDNEAGILRSELKRRKIDLSGIVVEDKRPTTLKRRIIADTQQLVRMDRELVREIKDESRREIISFCKSVVPDVQGIIISDYGKGVIDAGIVNELRGIPGVEKLPIAVDPKTTHFDTYKSVTIITPNRKEVEDSFHISLKNEKDLVRTGEKLLRALECEAVLVTRGEKGMSLFERNAGVTHIPAVTREVFDVTGAGDTVTCTLSLCLACGATIREGAIISNLAAGVVVGKRGTAVVKTDELLEMIQRNCEKDFS